jgi:integrase
MSWIRKHERKRSGPAYEAGYRDHAGAQHSRRFPTKRQAQQYLARAEVDLQRGEWTDPRLGRTTLGEWVDEWWATTNNLRPSTKARDAGYIERYILPSFGSIALARLTQLDVRAWVSDLSAEGLAPATVTKAYQILGKVMAAAVDSGLIPATPCRRVPLPKVEREEMRFLTPAEVGALADAIHPRYRALVLVGAYGGLRIGEIAGLRRNRVDSLKGVIKVSEICVEVAGALTFGHPKTRAGRRAVVLPRAVARELDDHLQRWAGTDFVFTAPEGGPLRVPAWRRRFWSPAITAAGLDPLRPHDLRHTAVAFWIATGANPLEVSRRAGHSSTSFTLDRYGHLFPQADQALADRLDALYVAPTAPATADVVSLRDAAQS